MRMGILLHFFVFVSGLLPSLGHSSPNPYPISEISTLSINSAITPATYDYLEQHIQSLPRTSLIVIKMNTPGGLVTTTKDIITLIGREKRPIVIWITPEGASASSAGAIVASAAHLIFMSPGTNIGAATPVSLGEDIKEGDGKNKAVKDLTAMVRSLSSSRGRPAAPFEKMITSADSYSDKEALNLNIINGIISNDEEIIPFIQDKIINIDGAERILIPVNNITYKDYAPTVGQKLLEVIANPSTAYILFLIGAALLYFEMQAPGGFIAGAFGVFSLILAAIAFQVLPLDWGSMGLVIVGLGLIVLEVFVTSYGVLAILGVLSLVIGSLFLFQGESGYISIEYPIILSSLAGFLTAVGLIVWYLWRDRKNQSVVKDFFQLKGAHGIVLNKKNGNYQVRVRGEIWNASSDEDLNIGDKIEVTSADTKQLAITIKRLVE